MTRMWYGLVIFTFPLFFTPTTGEKAIWCIPHADYSSECNRCWCLSNAVFICTHLKCKEVPKRFWGIIKPQLTKESITALEAFDKTITNRELPIMVKVLPKLNVPQSRGWFSKLWMRYVTAIKNIVKSVAATKVVEGVKKVINFVGNIPIVKTAVGLIKEAGKELLKETVKRPFKRVVASKPVEKIIQKESQKKERKKMEKEEEKGQ